LTDATEMFVYVLTYRVSLYRGNCVQRSVASRPGEHDQGTPAQYAGWNQHGRCLPHSKTGHIGCLESSRHTKYDTPVTDWHCSTVTLKTLN